MAVYSPNGKAHRALALLATGPATLEAIRNHGGLTGAKRRKMYHTLGAMLTDRLVTSMAGDYAITERGIEALEVLRQGGAYEVADVAVPSVRLFGRAA